jgi:hypothetical protein
LKWRWNYKISNLASTAERAKAARGSFARFLLVPDSGGRQMHAFQVAIYHFRSFFDTDLPITTIQRKVRFQSFVRVTDV